ncbi:hypothetical protein ONZ45_g19012 [Pleurotus djamor]|nr:hypothetical protein ONZ45_g19012 [Pleurotus djamor]
MPSFQINPSLGSASSPPWNSKRRQPKSPANDHSNETSQEDPLTHLHPVHSERTSSQPATSLAPSPSAQSTGQTSPESPFIVSTQSSSLESSHPIGGQSVPTSNREPLPNASVNVPTSSGPVRSTVAPSETSTQSHLHAPSHRHNSRISSEITSSSIASSGPITSQPSKTSSIQSSEHSSVHPSFNLSLGDINKPLELKDGHRLSFTLQDLPPIDAGTIVHAAVNAPQDPDPVLFGSEAAIRSSNTVSTEEDHDLNMVSSSNKPTFHQISPLLSSERVPHSADYMGLGTSAVTAHLTQSVTPTHQMTSQPHPVGIRLAPEFRAGELSTSPQSSFDPSGDEVPLEHASSASLTNEASPEPPSPLYQTMSQYFGEALESVPPPSDEGLLAELVQPSILYRRPGGTLSIEPRQISQSTFGPGASAVLSPTTIDIAFSSPARRLTQPQAYRQPSIRTFFGVPSISLPPEWSKLDNTGTLRIGSCSRCPRPVGEIVICQVSEDDDDDVEPAIVCEACLAENTPTPSQTFEMYLWANRRQVDQDDHIPELHAIKPVCDHCKDHIKQRGSWFHCISHRQNLNDLCTSCFESEQPSTQNEFIHCVVPVLKTLAQDTTSRLPSRPSAIQRESSTTSYTTSAPPSSLPETPFDIPFSDVIGVRSPGSGLYPPRDPLAPAEVILANIQEEVSSLPVKHLDQEFSTTPQRSASNRTSDHVVVVTILLIPCVPSTVPPIHLRPLPGLLSRKLEEPQERVCNALEYLTHASKVKAVCKTQIHMSISLLSNMRGSKLSDMPPPPPPSPPLPQPLPDTFRPRNTNIADYCPLAYQKVLNVEKQMNIVNAPDNEVAPLRVLGYLLQEDLVDTGINQLARSIMNAEDDQLVQLGTFYATYFMGIFYRFKGVTPAPSLCPSRDYGDRTSHLRMILQRPPSERSHSNARTLVFHRDGRRDFLSQVYDVSDLSLEAANFHAETRLTRNIIEAAHIIPEHVTEIGVNDTVPEIAALYTSSSEDVDTSAEKGLYMQSILYAFGGIDVAEKAVGDLIHDPSNILVLGDLGHILFDTYHMWFEPTDQNDTDGYPLWKVCYHKEYLRARSPDGLVFLTRLPPAKTVTIDDSTFNIPGPNAQYLRIHAACCRVAWLSGLVDILPSLFPSPGPTPPPENDFAQSDDFLYIVSSRLENGTVLNKDFVETTFEDFVLNCIEDPNSGFNRRFNHDVPTVDT